MSAARLYALLLQVAVLVSLAITSGMLFLVGALTPLALVILVVSALLASVAFLVVRFEAPEVTR